MSYKTSSTKTSNGPAYNQRHKPNMHALAWQDWADKNIGQLDLAVVLKLPMSSCHQHHDHLTKKLSKVLNDLDVRFMPQHSRNHTKRIPRFVSTEYDPGVGWHAHLAFRLKLDPYGFSILPNVFEAELRQRWCDTVGDTSERFKIKEIYVSYDPVYFIL